MLSYFNLFSRLSEVVKQLETFAPIRLAESWDNVGVLVEPSNDIEVKKILLTNDLTEVVLNEALENQANLIISYHPPIFAGLKRLTQKTWKERIVVRCLENKIAIYSPHTAWDSCQNGVNDWLAKSLSFSSIVPAIPNVVEPLCGAGRVCVVADALTLKEAVEKIKAHTNLPDVRVGVAFSASLDSKISNFGLCAGSGAGVLKEIKTPIDLFITGELSHHEALDAISRNISVVTLNHSNSERGFLKDFKEIFGDLIKGKGEIEVLIAGKDEDPLKTY